MTIEPRLASHGRAAGEPRAMNPQRILITLLVVALIGVVCWALLALVPLPSPFGVILVAVAVILTLVWLIREFGGGLGG